MSFVSYAQNFEDLMLWRALRHVGPGLYVDVGAQHPSIDSVSQAFYQHGWRGVHIEPVPRFAELLRADRPDETVLQVALSDRVGTLELNVIADTGLSTAVDGYAERHQSERGFAYRRVQVPVLTLASALQSLAGRQVHWLKIDVEGFEERVLRGWDSAALRPWVMVIEATVPNSTEQDYAAWDPILVGAGYRFVYFDGLNRFYIAAEHEELAGAFATPPNVFDDVELSGQGSWTLYRRVQESACHVRAMATEQLAAAAREAALARQQLAALSAQADALRLALEAAQEQVQEQAAQVHRWWSLADAHSGELIAIRASGSWRLARIFARVFARFARILAPVPRRPCSWPWPLRRVARGQLAEAVVAAAAPGASVGVDSCARPEGLSRAAARHYIQLLKAVEPGKS